MINEISYTWRLKISSSSWTAKTRSTSCNILWNFGNKNTLMKLRNLSQSLQRGQWRIWILLRHFEGLKLASVCLKTLTVTNSELQQLDKELWGRLFSCCEKILKGKATYLVNDSFAVSSDTHATSLSWSKRTSSWCIVQLLPFVVGFNKFSQTLWF